MYCTASHRQRGFGATGLQAPKECLGRTLELVISHRVNKGVDDAVGEESIHSEVVEPIIIRQEDTEVDDEKVSLVPGNTHEISDADTEEGLDQVTSYPLLSLVAYPLCCRQSQKCRDYFLQGEKHPDVTIRHDAKRDDQGERVDH